MIEQFELCVARRALQDEEFIVTMRAYAPRAPECAARDIVASAFKLISLHSERTMQDIDSRKVTPHDLRAELKVYPWTGLEDRIENHSKQWERDEILGSTDPRFTLEAANFGLAGVVSKLWTECLDDIVRLFIWRDSQVRRCRANQAVGLFGMGTLSIYSIAAGYFFLSGILVILIYHETDNHTCRYEYMIAIKNHLWYI